jgi:hypothetical protein
VPTKVHHEVPVALVGKCPMKLDNIRMMELGVDGPFDIGLSLTRDTFDLDSHSTNDRGRRKYYMGSMHGAPVSFSFSYFRTYSIIEEGILHHSSG